MFEPDFSLIVDKDLRLQVLRVEDAPILFQLVDRNRDHLREFLGWVDFSQSESDTSEFIKRELEKLSRHDGLTVAIWHKDILVGLVGYHDIDSLNRSASIGYWLDEKQQGQGIMRRAVKALLALGFNDMGLHRFEIQCAIDNTRSQQVSLSLGFKQEGTLRDAIWHYGEYFDAFVYSILSTEMEESE